MSLVYIRADVPYGQFSVGRDLESALHHEDGAPGCIALVEDGDVRPSDLRIDRATYDAEALVIRSYNAALPVPPKPPTPKDDLRTAVRAATTIPQLQAVVATIIEGMH
jgi:hypothetical protein